MQPSMALDAAWGALAYRLLTRNGSACQLERTGWPRGQWYGQTFLKSVGKVELMRGDGMGN